jgi:hypothetical protein
LDQLTGVAAILRFPMQELDDEVESSSDDDWYIFYYRFYNLSQIIFIKTIKDLICNKSEEFFNQNKVYFEFESQKIIKYFIFKKVY